MRGKDREIKNPDKIFDIIQNCSVAHVGMVENGKPYVVALNFGYERNGDSLILYFHSSYEGRKMDIFKKNPNVYFQMDCGGALKAGNEENPCAYSLKYDSVMGSGQVEFIEEPDKKSHALNCIIRHLGKTEGHFEFSEARLKNTCVYKVCSTDITGKHHD